MKIKKKTAKMSTPVKSHGQNIRGCMALVKTSVTKMFYKRLNANPVVTTVKPSI